MPTVNSNAKKIFGIPLTIGSIFSVGILSLVGALQFTSSWFLCSLAFVFAGFIEGQVLLENIFEVFKSFSDKNYIQRALLRKRLQNIFNKDDHNHDTNIFIAEYISQCRYLVELQHHAHDLSPAQQAELEKMQLSLQAKEDFLLKIIKSGDKVAASTKMELAAKEFIALTDHQLDDIDSLANEKYVWLWGAATLSAISGIGYFIATFSAFEAGFVFLGISSFIPLVAIIFVAAFGAAGFIFSLYQSILEVMKKFTLAELYQTTKKFLAEEKNYYKKIAVIFIALISIMATIATAGTWLKLISNEKTLSSLINKIATFIKIIVIVIMAIPTFIYSFVNACESAYKVAEKLEKKIGTVFKRALSKMQQELAELWRTENIIQIINPFRIIIKIFSGVSFMLHLFFYAIMSDQFPEPISSTVVGVINEAAIDAPYVFHEDDHEHIQEAEHEHHEHHEVCHHHDDEGHAHIDDNTKDKNNKIDLEDLDHKHHNHTELFSDILLFVPRLLAIAWDCLGGKLWPVQNTDPHSGKKSTTPHTLAQSTNKFFKSSKLKIAESYTPQDEWIIQEIIADCEVYIENCSSSKIDKLFKSELLQCKVTAFSTFKSQLSKGIEIKTALTELKEHKDDFAIHRHCSYFKTTTNAIELLNSIEIKAATLSN